MVRHQSIEPESNDTFTLKSDHINGDEFEFPRLFRDTVTADEIFSNGKLLPIFTNSKNDSLLKAITKPPVKSLTRRRSLSSLFSEDKEFDPPSCSSSETDEGVAIDTYCEWAPQKSSSTGTSKRWKFTSILKRCNSDNREGFVVYDVKDEKIFKKKSAGNANAVVVRHYASKKAEKDGNRQRTYMPYKQDLIGLFANINRSR